MFAGDHGSWLAADRRKLGNMSKADRLKEEIGWLKVTFAVAMALDASLVAWLAQELHNRLAGHFNGRRFGGHRDCLWCGGDQPACVPTRSDASTNWRTRDGMDCDRGIGGPGGCHVHGCVRRFPAGAQIASVGWANVFFVCPHTDRKVGR